MARKKSGPPKAKPKGKAKAREPRAARPEGSLVRGGMYRQGRGACFLLSSPRRGPSRPDGAGPPYHVLIDCGIIPGTPDGADRMRQVALDIKETTGGRID